MKLSAHHALWGKTLRLLCALALALGILPIAALQSPPHAEAKSTPISVTGSESLPKTITGKATLKCTDTLYGEWDVKVEAKYGGETFTGECLDYGLGAWEGKGPYEFTGTRQSDGSYKCVIDRDQFGSGDMSGYQNIGFSFVPKGKITITKKSIDPSFTGKYPELFSLEGAVFQLKSGSKVVATLTTNSKGVASADGIPFGEYTLTETTPPKGFEKPSGSADVVVNADATYTVTDSYKPPFGKLSLTKTSASPNVTKGHPLYSLAGAEYGVFQDKACTNLVATLTLSETGASTIDSILAGTYYVKETKAPTCGAYKLDSTVKTVTVEPDSTAKVSFADQPVFDPGRVFVNKIDSAGNEAPIDADHSLAGAQFQVDYFAAWTAEGTPTRTWVFQTGENGRATLAAKDKVSGDDLYVDQFGNEAFPLGTYQVKEIKAPNYYYINDEVKTFTLKANSKGEIISWDNEATTTWSETPSYLRTTAVGTESGTHECQFTEGQVVSITDTCEYHNFEAGQEHTITGTLMDKEAKEPLLDAEGNEITSSVTFTAEEADGTVDVVFEFAAPDLTGKTTVAFESAVRTSDGVEVAAHKQFDDAEQTVSFISMGTTAKNEATQTQLGTLEEAMRLIDTVNYTNLTPGQTYTLRATLMDKATGKTLMSDEEPVAATTEFTPEESDGSADVAFVFDARMLAGKTCVVFEQLFDVDSNLVARHEDLDDEGQSIHWLDLGTTATNAQTGGKTLPAAAQVTVKDTVAYSNLIPGIEYTISGTLMSQKTAQPLKDATGAEITTSQTFVAQKSTGTVDLSFTFDSSLLKGQTLVVFESMYAEDALVGAHQDINDQDQSVSVPSIKTKAHGEDGEKAIEATANIAVIDTVEYAGLMPGVKYTLTGTLMDKKSGKALVDAKGKPATAEASFTPTASAGSIDVTFVFDASKLADTEAVAFEKLYEAEALIAAHEDLNDNDQTVSFFKDNEPNEDRGLVKTGDNSLPLIPIALMAFAFALLAIGAYIMRSQRTRKAMHAKRRMH